MNVEPAISSHPELYAAALADYLQTRSEAALSQAAWLSKIFVENGRGPQAIIAFHVDAFSRMVADWPYREQARASANALQFLLEVMITYGTEYKAYAESMLDQQAREAEQSEREKMEILAVIAHELRTPLTAAMGNLDLAVRSLSRGQLEQIPGLLRTAREALGRLSRLSADLVEASRGEPLPLKYTWLELGELVAQACTWARVAAEAKGVSLIQESEVGSCRVLGNADALLSILGNLLSNAIRYTPAGGRITVRHGLNSEGIWVEVADTGLGMTPDVQSRIFEKFYRAPEAHTITTQGLGLGLSLVQDLVRAHGGRVEVESAPRQGSTFRVILPVAGLTNPDESGN